MKAVRLKYPLMFALVAALLSILAFQLFPSWDLSTGLVDTGALRQSATAALVVAVMYMFSGEFLAENFAGMLQRDESAENTGSAETNEAAANPKGGKQLIRRIAMVVLAAAAVIGVAKVLVQKSLITPPTTAILIFIAVLLATAVFEEILFRGFFFEAFAKTLRERGVDHALLWATIASSVLFGMLHVSSDLGSLFRVTAYVQAAVKILEGCAFGLALCALYLKTKSVWPCVGLHAAFDLISELPIYLATGVRTSTYITGSPADIAVLLAGTAVLAFAAKWAIDYVRGQKDVLS